MYFTDTTMVIDQKISDDDAVHVGDGRLDRAVVDREHGLHRVERAGADVAEHDAERAEREAVQAAAVRGRMIAVAATRRAGLRRLLLLGRGGLRGGACVRHVLSVPPPTDAVAAPRPVIIGWVRRVAGSVRIRAERVISGASGDQRPQPVGARRQRGRPDDLMPLRLGPVLVAPRPQPRRGQPQVVLAGEADRAVHLVRDRGRRRPRPRTCAPWPSRSASSAVEHTRRRRPRGRGLGGGRRRGDLGGGQRQATAAPPGTGRSGGRTAPAPPRTAPTPAAPPAARPASSSDRPSAARRRSWAPTCSSTEDAVTGAVDHHRVARLLGQVRAVGDGDVGGVDQQHVVARQHGDPGGGARPRHPVQLARGTPDGAGDVEIARRQRQRPVGQPIPAACRSQPASRSVSTSGTRAACAPAAASTTAASANAPSLPPASPGRVSRARPVLLEGGPQLGVEPDARASRLPNTSSAKLGQRVDARAVSALLGHRSPSPRATMPRSTSLVPPAQREAGGVQHRVGQQPGVAALGARVRRDRHEQPGRVDDLVLVAGAEVLHHGCRELGRRPGGERTGDGERHPPQRPQPGDQRRRPRGGRPGRHRRARPPARRAAGRSTGTAPARCARTRARW